MRLLKACAQALLLVLCCSSTLSGQSGSAPETKAPVKGLDLSYIDKAADPCTDFYKYACGNFAKTHPMPSDMPMNDGFVLLYEENERILHDILEKYAGPNPGRTANQQKVGDYYATCLNVDAVNKSGLAPLKPELDRIAALKSKDELGALLADYQRRSIGAFLSFGEQQDFNDASLQIAVLDQGGLGLPERDYYLRTGEADKKLRDQYVEHVARTFELLGEPKDKAAQDAKTVLDVETALAKSSLDVTSQRDPHKVYHMMTVADVKKLAPSLNWDDFLPSSPALRRCSN